MIVAHELSRHFDRKSGCGSFELVAVELDVDRRFIALGAFGQFHYTHLNDYAAVRRQAEADTCARYRRIRHLEAQFRNEDSSNENLPSIQS